MVKVTVLVVGKVKDGHIGALISYYEKLLSRGEVIVEMVTLSDPSGKRTQEMGKRLETDLLKKILPKYGKVWYLSEHGKNYTSSEFSRWIAQEGENSGKLTVLVGGPYGVYQEELSSYLWGSVSLSSLTFTHEMTLLIFLEQLYRAGTILAGKAYHHE